ncbi:hypothetical protein CC78DRAFT_382961 [Lojkania enalia]|uniref:Uncharacterized protein n=1 Tax=Lojkania enalia TaxID=147567 RepID=A0A9P4K2I6_9PLEO|nr:hypothetical protein CC78DRAFT_382961 [Didymosphaeria enalia]
MDPNELPSSSLLGDTSFLFEPLPLEDSEMPLLFAGQPGGVLWAPNSIATNLNSMPSSLSDQAGNVLISDSILLADNETPMSLSGPPNSVLYPFELDEPGPTNISLSLSASPDPAVHRFDWSTPGVNNMSWAMSDSSPEPPDPSDTFPMDFDSPPWCPTPGSNEEMPSVPHAGLASAESASSERLISRKDWEELQQDFGPFGTYTNNLYDPDTPQESIQFKGLKREDIIKPYGMPRGPMPTYQQNSPLTSLRPWVPPEEIFWANLHQEQTAPNIGPSNVQLPQQSAYLVTSNPSLCLSSIEPLIINHPYASMVGQQRRTETRPPTNLVPHPTRSPQAHIDPSFSLPTMNASTPIHTLAPRGTIARMKTLPPMPTQAPFNPPPILYSAPFNTPPHMVTQAPFNISAPLLTPAPLNIIGPLPQFESTNTQSPIMGTV